MLPPSMHHKVSSVALIGVAWVIGYTGQASWFFTQ